jgi:hypothetical protein
MSVGGAGGRLYLEGLADMLTVHLLRGYGSSERPPIPHRGGLAPGQMRRVLRGSENCNVGFPPALFRHDVKVRPSIFALS